MQAQLTNVFEKETLRNTLWKEENQSLSSSVIMAATQDFDHLKISVNKH